MSKLDGSPEPLTYGEALVAIAQKIAWGSEAIAYEVVRTIQTEHDIVPPDPDKPAFTDPRDATLVAQEAELAELRAEKARRQAEDQKAANERELAELRAEKDAQTSGKTTAK